MTALALLAPTPIPTPAPAPSSTPPSPLSLLADAAVLSLPSVQSRRAYSRELRRYLASGRPLSRDGLQAHVHWLRTLKAGPVTMNHAVSAVRLLAREAYARGLLCDQELYAIETVKGMARRGIRAGNWLELAGLQELIRAAGEGLHGTRNAAIVACMCGCGMRRDEVARLDWRQWQRRSGRYVWLDVTGKAGKVRTIPCPPWAARLIERWRESESEQRQEQTT